MNDERIENYRGFAEAMAGTLSGDALAECLDEIERLRAVLQRISDHPANIGPQRATPASVAQIEAQCKQANQALHRAVEGQQ